MELRDYLTILWRRKWVIAVTLAVTMTVVVIGTLQATPAYVASATLRVLTPSSGSVDWAQYNVGYAERLMKTYAELATSSPALEELTERLNGDVPPQIEVEILPGTELMRIPVEDPDPFLTAEAANALAETLVAQSRELYAGGGKTAPEILGEQLAQVEEELSQARMGYESLVTRFPESSERVAAASETVELKQRTYAMLLEQYERARAAEAIRANTVSVVEPAVVPRIPSKPHKKLNIALGAMVGLAGGVGLAFLFENLDTTLYTTEQIETATELSALGQIPVARGRRQSVFFNGRSPEGEAFRHLRTNILRLDEDAPPKTLLVTSAEPEEGKSMIVANLASAIAQSDRKVIVVDGDLRRPTIHKVFNLPNEIGLSSILNQEANLEQAVQGSKISGVQVLTSGPLPDSPAELLGSQEMTALIMQLAQQFDVVLLDTPSLLAVTDAAVLAPTVDCVVLVVRRAKAQREAVRAARRRLVDVKVNSIGVVVNRATRDGLSSYYQKSFVEAFLER